MVNYLMLFELEYGDALLNSPDFQEKLKAHEDYIETTIKNVDKFLKQYKNMPITECEFKKQQECLLNFF